MHQALASNPDTKIETKVNHRSFDPKEWIEDHMTETALRYKVMTSAVWALDQTIIQAARSLYWSVRNENPEAGGDTGALIDAFNGTYSNESYWGTGDASLLIDLVTMQPDWHDAAYVMAAANGNLSYEPKSIDVLVLESKPIPVNETTVANLKVMANSTSVMTGGKITPEEALKIAILGRQERATKNAQFARELCPAIHVFIQEAKNVLSKRLLRNEQVNVDFTDLPTMTKVGMLSKINGSITRAISDLAAQLDSMAFAIAHAEAINAKFVITDVLDKLASEIERDRS